MSGSCAIVVRRDGGRQPCGYALRDTRYVCDWHVAKVERALDDAPLFYVALRAALVPTSGGSDRQRVGGSKAAPLPLNASARSLQEDMTRICLAAERDYRARRGWSGLPRRGRESMSLAGSAQWLSRHVDDIAETPIALDLVELVDTMRTARRVLGLDRLVHRLPAPCPSCDCMALEREDGDSWVRCRYCGRRFGEDDYRRLCLILASDYNREAEAA